VVGLDLERKMAIRELGGWCFVSVFGVLIGIDVNGVLVCFIC
jgi:hypothetical protein